MPENPFKLSLGIIIVFILITIPSIAAKPSLQNTDSLNLISIPILTYHRIIPKPTSIYDFSPTMLEQHFKYFKTHGYQPITAAQFMEYQKHPELFPPKPIILTFDDGNKSHYTRALPLLQKYGFPATFFVYPQAVKENSKILITWSELKEMADAGMDIESHSMTHPFLSLSKVPQGDNSKYLKWLNSELLVSRALLEYRLERKVSLLAYPYGWYDTVVENEAIKAGYHGIFTVNWGQNSTTENPLRLKRRVMDHTMSLRDLVRYITARPLDIQIISPIDAGIVTQPPVVQFKINNPEIKKATVIVRRLKAELTPDSQGIYTFAKLNQIKPGYCMVIIKAFDQKNNYYLSSWGFNFQTTGNPKKPLQKNPNI